MTRRSSPPPTIWRKIPGAAKVVIPAAGHAVNIDQPQAFIDAVLLFLGSLDVKATQKAAS